MGKSPGITAVQRRTLDQLKQIPELAGFYLAGDTAIGAQLGHRQSLDLDLFSVKSNADIARVQRSIVRAIPATTVLSASDVALSLRNAQVATAAKAAGSALGCHRGSKRLKRQPRFTDVGGQRVQAQRRQQNRRRKAAPR